MADVLAYAPNVLIGMALIAIAIGVILVLTARTDV